MERAVYETLEQDGYKAEVVQEEYADDPRECWDNAGTMVCFHTKYMLGDKVGGKHDHDDVGQAREAMEAIEEAGGVVLPLFLYDHSGVGMSTDNSRYPFNCPWDAGQVGWIYVEAATITEEWGKDEREQAAACLQSEVETYDQFLRGDVYGYILCGPDGDALDSCWGFYGTDSAVEEAQNMIDYHLREDKKTARIMTT